MHETYADTRGSNSNDTPCSVITYWSAPGGAESSKSTTRTNAFSAAGCWTIVTAVRPACWLSDTPLLENFTEMSVSGSDSPAEPFGVAGHFGIQPKPLSAVG